MSDKNKARPGRCRVCGCTYEDACPAGCSWVEDSLCSVCATAADAISQWIEDVRRVNKAGLWREALRSRVNKITK